MKALALAVLGALVACGGSTQSSGVVDGGGGGAGPCPSSPPAAGAGCTSAQLQCEYGSDPDKACNTVATCSAQGQWSVAAPLGAPTCPTPPAAGDCPASYAAGLLGAACAKASVECAYPEGLCGCVPPPGPPRADGGLSWICDHPGAGCPSPRPRLGTACAGSLSCSYGGCALPNGLSEVCKGGVWVSQPIPCIL